MRPVCVYCCTPMAPSKNDRGYLETHSDGQPFRLWSCDEYQCKCGNRVLTGFGYQAIAEHYEDDFQGHLDFYKDNLITEQQEI